MRKTTALIAAGMAAMTILMTAPAYGGEPEPSVARGPVVLLRNGKTPLCLTANEGTKAVTVVACLDPPCTTGTCIGPVEHTPLDQQWLVSRGSDHDWTYIISGSARGMSLSIGPVRQQVVRAGLANVPIPLLLGGNGGTQFSIKLGQTKACLSRFYAGGALYALWVACGKGGYWQGWQLPQPAE
jgi:hypothetical protein